MDRDEQIARKIEEEFGCRRCTECCRQPGYVYMTEAECAEAAALLGCSIYDFMDRYCDLVDRRRIVLKKLPDETCIFLKSNACEIHSAKPGQCRDFPLRWRTPRSFEYCQGLKALFENPAS